MCRHIIAVAAGLALAVTAVPNIVHAQSAASRQEYTMQNRQDFTTQNMGPNAPVSQLLGKEVRGRNGESLGTIRDFVMDPNGRIQYALLASNSVPGKLIPMPFEALYPGTPMYFSSNLTKDRLASAPAFSLNNLTDPAWNDQVYRYYGLQPASQQARNMGYQDRMAQSANQFYDLNRLVGADVRGMNGERLGTIKNFVLDPYGHTFAVMAPADSNRTIAVPFEAFSSIGDGQATLNVDKTRLANAPDYSTGALSDPNWERNVYSSFGVQPQWGHDFSGQFGTSGQNFRQQ
ncbi:MAG TPA: PRC-barrel domain-containing protein [Thermodesulfobacteriota bacterium]|nr:PRC-barrel domain-containing protein [Thermodesulfobacteriota bacterium]